MKKNKEQGIALLYALGILALLTAMALAFINSSIFDQRASAQSASSIMAEQLAISTMQRLIWGIQQSKAILPADASGLSEDAASYSYMPRPHYSFNGIVNANILRDIARDGLDIGATIDDDTVKNDLLYVEELKNHFNYKATNYRNGVRWMLHRVRAGGTNAAPVNRVIGRTAFVLVPLGGGKINPSDLVDKYINEWVAGTDYPETRIGKNMDEINIKAMTGVLLPENVIKFFNYPPPDQNGARPPSGWDESFFQKLKAGLYPTTKIPKQVRDVVDEAFTFDTPLSGEYYLMDIGDDGVFDARERQHRFFLPRFTNTGEYWDTSTPAANYWNDANFNINRDILLTPPPAGASIPSTRIDQEPPLALRADNRFDNDREDLANIPPIRAKWGVGIPWLATFGLSDACVPDETLAGTFPLVWYRRQQIAANLKDYCDGDNIPTSNLIPGTLANTLNTQWGYQINVPTYTGNEKTPYINELEISTNLELSITDDTATGGNKTASVVLDLSMAGEIINIYKDLPNPPPNTTKLQVLCQISGAEVIIEWDGNAAISKPITLGGAGVTPTPAWGGIVYRKIDLPTTWQAGAATGHFSSPSPLQISVPFVSDAIASPVGGPPPILPSTGKVTVKYKIKIVRAILEYDGGNVDFANINQEIDFTSDPLVFDASSVSGGPVSVTTTPLFKTVVHSFQTEDSRQNLNPGDWTLTTELSPTGYVSPPSNIGKINLKSNPSGPTATAGEFDIEIATNPAYLGPLANQHISTAYIRNAPMISPWELGLIHRGEKWQTINLKKYDHTKAFKTARNGAVRYYPLGGGKYSDGDANILDQIKMTPEKESPLKVNLKGTGKMVLDGLLNVQNMGLDGGKDFVGRANAAETVYSNLCNELGGGPSVSPTNLSAVNEKIRENFVPDRLPAGEYDTRAALANIVGIDNGGTTDAAKEEWIGKIINLTETSRSLDLFEMVIVAQAIHDVGNVANPPPQTINTYIPISKYYRDANHKLSAAPLVMIRSRLGEINWNNTTGAGVIADEILAQRKIRVRGFRKPNGNVQILSIKTVE